MTPDEAIARAAKQSANRRQNRDLRDSTHHRLIAELVAEGWNAREFRSTLVGLLMTVMTWDRERASECVPTTVPDAWRIVPVGRGSNAWFRIELAEVNVSHWPSDDKWFALWGFCDYYEIDLWVMVVDRNGVRSYPHSWMAPT